MKLKITVLPGDGVGPEVASEGVKVLKRIAEKYGHELELLYGDIGGISIDNHGVALTREVLRQCKKSHAVYLGAVGGPKWDDPLSKVRPEDGLLALRKELKLFANLRPVKVFPELVNHTNLKPEVVKGVDFIPARNNLVAPLVKDVRIHERPAVGVELAGSRRKGCPLGLFRRFCNDIYHSGEGVCTVERRAGTPDDFDALNLFEHNGEGIPHNDAEEINISRASVYQE